MKSKQILSKVLENPNKNIFQVCIGLNDNIPNLRRCRKRFLEINSTWNYILIQSREDMDLAMERQFKQSTCSFENKIYEAYISIPKVLGYEKRARALVDSGNTTAGEELHKVGCLVSATDFFRTAMVYKFGGLYLDFTSFLMLDIEKELACNDSVFIKTDHEIRSSCFFAKKGNELIKKIIETQVYHCLEKKEPSQYLLGGPGAFSAVLIKGSVVLQNVNCKILNERELSRSIWMQDAPWKKKCHLLDPSQPNKKINQHWLWGEDLHKP